MKVHYTKTQVLIFLLILLTILSSIFPVLSCFPDELIEPKWYLSIISLSILLSVIGFLKIFGNKSITAESIFISFAVCVFFSSYIESILVISQTIGILYPYTEFSQGTFDNLAGLVSFQAIAFSLAIILVKNKISRKIYYLATAALIYLSDYELCLLRGEILHNLKKTEDAIIEYNKAHNMCPSRIMPLYELYLIHRECGNDLTADSLRSHILSIKPKVDNSYTISIYNELKNNE